MPLLRLKREKEERVETGRELAVFGQRARVATPVYFAKPREGWQLVEEYWVSEPHARVKVLEIPELGSQLAYFVEESPLDEREGKVAKELAEILSVEMEPPPAFEEDVRAKVIEQARRVAERYRAKFKLPEQSWSKVLYYVERDLLGYGPIEVMMRDPYLEDISCPGALKPIYVWHRKYESMPSNVVFVDRDYLREFIVKLAHIAGKHVSVAFPVVDARLPGGHRLAATYGEEISPRGSTFTIRKFRERPFSIVELVELGTLDSWTAAYLWLMIEHRMTVMIVGGTAAGKTTLLNALLNFVKPSFKIVTVEETPEINIEHENWVQLTTRESYGLSGRTGEIDLYELVRVSLRYRPDYIIVGEIRGREAYVLFQALATGHGGLSTFHSDSLENMVKRLMSPPMNVSEPYIPLMNVVVHVERVPLPRGGFGRRVRTVWEVEDYGRYREIVKWNPLSDEYEVVGDSYLLAAIAARTGKSLGELKQEIEDRKAIIEWLVRKGIKDFREVAKIVTKFYMFPDRVKNIAKAELLEEAAPGAAEPSEKQLEILKVLHEKGGALDLEALAESLGSSPSDIESEVAELSRKNLVKVARTSKSAHLVLGLTEDGRAYLDKVGGESE